MRVDEVLAHKMPFCERTSAHSKSYTYPFGYCYGVSKRIARLVSPQASDMEATRNPHKLLRISGVSDDIYEFATNMAYVWAPRGGTLFRTGEFILAFGNRTKFSTRTNKVGLGFYAMSETLYNQVYAYNNMLTTPLLCALGVDSYMMEYDLPLKLRLYFSSFAEIVLELSRRKRYHMGDDAGRAQCWKSAFRCYSSWPPSAPPASWGFWTPAA